MGKIITTLKEYSLGRGFLIVTVIFLLILIIGLILMLIIGLWNNEVVEIFTHIYKKLSKDWNKILAFYLSFCFLFAITDMKN